MVDLSQVPHTELESDLILHEHDKSEVLNELRSHLVSTEHANPSVVEARKPIHEPKFDHEVAADLLTNSRVELLLSLSA